MESNVNMVNEKRQKHKKKHKKHKHRRHSGGDNSTEERDSYKRDSRHKKDTSGFLFIKETMFLRYYFVIYTIVLLVIIN